jgi:hypothetical protein
VTHAPAYLLRTPASIITAIVAEPIARRTPVENRCAPHAAGVARSKRLQRSLPGYKTAAPATLLQPDR